VTGQASYDWRAAPRLLVDGNGWQTELRLHRIDGDGSVAGEMYGDAVDRTLGARCAATAPDAPLRRIPTTRRNGRAAVPTA
jgi:hypothetical protein